MHPSAGALLRVLGFAGIALLAGCASTGMKSPSATKTVAAANVSPTSVDADIQRILTAGGISPDDPAVAALQTPPSQATPGSAWEGGPTAQAPVQVAALDPAMSVTNPGVIGVENIGETNMSASPAVETAPAVPITTTTTAVLPDTIGFQPNLQTSNPALPAGSGAALPPSVMAGILPVPDYAVQQPVAAVASQFSAPAPRAPVPVVPRIRPSNLGVATTVAAYAPAPIDPVLEMLPLEALPQPPSVPPPVKTTVRRF